MEFQHPLMAVCKDIGVLSIVVPELKFCDIERQVFLADFVEASHNGRASQATRSLRWSECGPR